MTTIVDASVAIRWFVHEPGHAEALELLDRQDELYAPDIIVPEVVDAVWRRIRDGLIGDAQGSAIVAAVTSGVPTLVPAAEFAEEALRKGTKMEQASLLAFYLSCAEALGADFVSADETAVGVARDLLAPERVRLLSEWVS